MKTLKFYSLLTTFLFGALLITSCGDDDEDDPMKGAKSPDAIEWAQHQYQVTTAGITWGEGKWNDLYASIYQKWEFSKGNKKDKTPLIFFSHYRWFPKNYGPTYWTEKLENGNWYFDGRYDSHSIETKTLENGNVEMTFSMQGRTWKGILTDGNIVLTSTDGEATITLNLLPITPYDGSYNDILEQIL